MNKPLTYGLLLSILMSSRLTPTSAAMGQRPVQRLLIWRAYLTYSGNPLPQRCCCC